MQSSRRMVVVEFPDGDRVKEWYAPSECAEALEIRKSALERRLLLVQGVPEQRHRRTARVRLAAGPPLASASRPTATGPSPSSCRLNSFPQQWCCR
ncbi:DUF1330 domain-containing protein [Streptomyces noursei]|uniref:DUF1330 domain-containing protein n=1 Tax=Streptomyces noursei TaxID=1971 RepID=UPI001963B22D|nr:DUF1330 domain-containing protein [Streptomyces noursei]